MNCVLCRRSPVVRCAANLNATDSIRKHGGKEEAGASELEASGN
jgi:hypothetical protein